MKKLLFQIGFIGIPASIFVLTIFGFFTNGIAFQSVAQDYAVGGPSIPLPSGVSAQVLDDGVYYFRINDDTRIDIYGNCSDTDCDRITGVTARNVRGVDDDDLVGNQDPPSPVYTRTGTAGWSVEVYYTAREGEGADAVQYFQINVYNNGVFVSDRGVMVVKNGAIIGLNRR